MTSAESLASESAPRIKLRSLEIHRFRNVKPTRLTFNEGFNVLLGKNATGKTSLLKLIEILLRDEKDKFPQENFDLSYELSIADATLMIRCTSQEQERVVGGPGGQKRYDLSWHGNLVLPEGTHSFSSDEHSKDLRINAPRAYRVACAVLDEAAKLQQVRRGPDLPYFLWRYSYWTERMDEGTDTFRTIKEATPMYGQLGERELLFLGARVFPLEVFGHKPLSWYASVHVGQTLGSGWGNGRMPEIARALGLKDGQILAVIKTKTRDGDDAELSLGDVQFVFQRNDGSEFTDEYLSFGQKRFLTFLYLLWCNEHVCIADELVNGLHHDWIRQAIGAIGQRQAFLTSQNPILFDYIPLTSQQDAQRSFLLCGSEVDEKGAEWLVWKNVEEADARRIFDAYESGLETLGQILETRGLW